MVFDTPPISEQFTVAGLGIEALDPCFCSLTNFLFDISLNNFHSSIWQTCSMDFPPSCSQVFLEVKMAALVFAPLFFEFQIFLRSSIDSSNCSASRGAAGYVVLYNLKTASPIQPMCAP